MKSLEDFQREHGGGERYVLDPDQLSEREKLVNRCKERCLYLIEHAEKSESVSGRSFGNPENTQRTSSMKR